MGRIMREFRADVKEYLGIEREADLMKLAQRYRDHATRFWEYQAAGNLAGYYRDSENAYLARACYVRSEDRPHQFDTYVLNTVRADVPGVGMDFGCGAAPITFELLRKGQTIYFHDIEGSGPFEFLKWRVKKYHLESRAFFNEWPAAESLDYVLCLDSIEHLENWREVLANIAQVLKPRAALITNFVLLTDIKNPEHIFTDRKAFMEHVTTLKLWPLNTAIFQKRTDFLN
jgi:2-polyprenyl-3-methyl-5-hydroxy-6-metoxy-1,4-benzoquinol methylase